MEEKVQLSRFIAEVSLDDLKESSECKEIWDGIFKYLKSRLDLLKHKETDTFKYILQIIELRNVILREAKQKSAQLAVETKHMNPLHLEEDGDLVANYFLEGMFDFDNHSEEISDSKTEDFTTLQREVSQLSESMPGSLPTLLFLRDHQDQHALFVLQYSDKNLRLEKLYHYYPEESEKLGASLSERELNMLISKMKQFLGQSYLGIKQIVVDDLQKFLLSSQQQDKLPGTPNTFMGKSFMDSSSFLYS